MASPAAATFNSKSPSIKRILRESRELSSSPDPTLSAGPLDSNLFEWHFTLQGPPASPYESGIYHGRIVLPPSYPLRPPAFRFLTPSGRFETNREICLSISGHHEETWQPAWGIRTALMAIRAFMAGDARGQVGGLDMHPEAREKLARLSRSWKCASCGQSNEEIMRETEKEWRENHGGEESKEEVPEELRLAFREDLGKGEKDGETQAPEATSEAETLRPSAAGATPLSPLPMSPRSLAPPTPRTPGASIPLPPRSPLNHQPPTPMMPGSPRNHLPPSATASALQGESRVATSASVAPPPDWIDKAIVGVVLALVLMVLKRLAGSVED